MRGASVSNCTIGRTHEPGPAQLLPPGPPGLRAAEAQSREKTHSGLRLHRNLFSTFGPACKTWPTPRSFPSEKRRPQRRPAPSSSLTRLRGSSSPGVSGAKILESACLGRECASARGAEASPAAAPGQEGRVGPGLGGHCRAVETDPGGPQCPLPQASTSNGGPVTDQCH